MSYAAVHPPIREVGLTTITIPDSVTDIAGGAFSGCTGLTAIEVAPLNPAYVSLDDVLFDKSGAVLIQYPLGNTGPYTIPDSATEIASSAFSGCTGVTTITIPDSVTGIGPWAFSDCTHLTRVTIGKGVSDIMITRSSLGGGCYRSSPFMGCTSLLSIDVDVLNSAYSSVDGVLFNKEGTTLISCPEAKTGGYVVPGSVASIGRGAFAGCTSLTSIAIPDSVTSIEGEAFGSCDSLNGLHFRGSAPSIVEDAFDGAYNVRCYYLPGAAGWGATLAGRETALWIPLTTDALPATATERLKLHSSSPAPATLRVQRSTNLHDWEDWQTVSRDEGPGELYDSEADTVPYRFYRMVED